MESPVGPGFFRAFVRRNAAALVLLLGGSLTLWTTVYARGMVSAERKKSFASAQTEVMDGIQERMDAYVSLLRGARGLLGSHPERVTRAEFREYVASLELQQHYPGIQGIGYAEIIPEAGLSAREERARAEGLTDFRIWPPGARGLYTAITLLEPLDWRNRRALGFDMATESTRQEAMERAARTRRPAASGKVFLVQEVETDRQPGFLLYLPLEGVQGETSVLKGWVYAPFRTRDLFHGIFGSTDSVSPQVALDARVNVEIFDGAQMDPAHLLYASPPRDGQAVAEGLRAGEAPELSEIAMLEVAGRPWWIRVSSRAGFDPTVSRYTPAYVFGAGLLITLLLVVITRDLIRSRARAEAQARRGAFLAEATAVLSRTLDPQVALKQLTQLCVPSLSDFCAAEMLDEDNVIRPAAMTKRGSADETWTLAQRRQVKVKEGGPLDRAVREAKASLFPVVTDAMWKAWVPETESPTGPRQTKPGSYLCVPLTSRGRTLGALTFLSRQPGRFGESELSLARELAERAAAAVDNARLYQQAQESLRLREEFLSVAAHELKTPLTVLTLNVRLLERQRPSRDGERLSHSLDMMARQVKRLGNLVDQLLEVTVAPNGRRRLGREEVELAQLVRDVVAKATVDIHHANCVLELDLPTKVVGLWDRIGLEQVMAHLLSNALKYGPGKPIRISLVTDARTARVSVRDEGIGISPKDLGRVFERLERAVPAQNYGGLGLGLYISRQIIEAQGGTLSAESIPGRGATFTMELPLDPERKEAAPADGTVGGPGLPVTGGDNLGGGGTGDGHAGPSGDSRA